MFSKNLIDLKNFFGMEYKHLHCQSRLPNETKVKIKNKEQQGEILIISTNTVQKNDTVLK